MQFKKISVITPAFNRKDMLESAIKNVLAQNYPNIEHIVVDGGSTDGTREMIEKYPHARFLSEPDRGMYDALNKGIRMSGGEVIGFLNTDDLYVDNILADAVAGFADESVMAVAGHAVVLAQKPGGEMEIIGRYAPTEMTLLESSTIGSNYFNAWLFRRSVFDKIGEFDARYRIAGDRDLMLRFALNKLRYVEFDQVVYRYFQHSESLTFNYTTEKRDQVVREHLEMADFHLENRELSTLERKMIFQLRTNESVDMATRAIKGLHLSKFFRCAYDGLQKDPWWVFKFLKATLIFRIVKIFGRDKK